MKIENIEEIRNVFSIFHDGEISKARLKSSDLFLEVEIAYLADRVSPGFSAFSLCLTHVENLMFTTWPNNTTLPSEIIVDPKKIFILELEMLSATINGKNIEVECVLHNQDFEFIGGVLSFSANSMGVQDESGRYYSVEELRKISEGYWNEWASKIK